MKHKYIFIHCASVLNPGTPWVTLWIGESQREKSLLRFFKRLASSSDFYFRQWSADVVEFRDRVAASFYPGVTAAWSRLRSFAMDARQLRDILLDGFPGQPDSDVSPTDIAQYVQRRVATARPLPSRYEENLSPLAHTPQSGGVDPDGFYRALAGFSLILGILVLDWYLTTHIFPM